MIVDSEMQLKGFQVIEMNGAKMRSTLNQKTFQAERKLCLKTFQDVYLSVNGGVVYCSDGSAILDSVYMVDKHALSQEAMSSAECLHFADLCPVVTYNAGWRNYYHNLVQSGLSTWIVAKFFAESNPHFIFPELKPNYLDIIKSCGVPDSSFTLVHKSKIIKLAKVGIIDTTYGGYAYAPSSLLKEYSKDLVRIYHNIQKKAKFLYISRRDSHNRKLVNEHLIEQMMTQLGFTVVSLSNMPFFEQVSLFHSADVLVSPHGAGLANAIFCKEETKIIELTMDSYVNTCFVSLSQALELDHHLVVAPSIQRTANKNDSTWNLNLEEFRSILVTLISEVDG